MKKSINIKFQNGITYQMAVDEIFSELHGDFEFIESNQPDFILFGPYGNDIPAKGNYTRIGYYCENITPDLSNCEWAFGIPSEDKVNDPRYRRIQWHNLDPKDLVKHNWDVDQIFSEKTKFCNFLYSSPVPYREEFFRALSKYKKIDAPGKSMNNMPSVDSTYQGDKWAVKRQFLSSYKFTIAFENYIYPGYQTEKLYDAMLCKSLPIYCGDPNIGSIFNTNSFLNAADYAKPSQSKMIRFLENISQPNFTDILPAYRKSPVNRLQRKLKSLGRGLKMNLQFKQSGFDELIDRVIFLDKNPAEYIKYLQQPWFNNNTQPKGLSLKKRWQEIFLADNNYSGK